jgi:hypothetical protein
MRTGERIEISANPNGLSNYFQPESTLPLEMSPAFFKTEVLHKYKADGDKYETRDRSIYCRGTWELRTYDINDAGQVHTDLRYLGELPFKEQLYWQAFNEWPRGPISERAVTTDFKGEWYTDYDSLNSLKHRIGQLDESRHPWWLPRGRKLAAAVHYPATAASDEWADEILALDQLFVEGFKAKELKALALRLNRAIEPQWGSLKLLEECLAGSGLDGEEVATTIAPIKELHELRTIVKGHAASNKRKEREKQAIAGAGSFRAHFAQLAAGCDSALETVVAALSKQISE